jgi:hyaluronoglucosaminidase
MSYHNTIPVGIIEGFFGRSWSDLSRRAYAKFLAQHQFDFYIYAPKNDTYLRRRWQEDWPADLKKSLVDLRQIYAENNIAFGIGLSPLEIWCHSQDTTYANFKKRIQQLNDLSPDILCILFDDMRGDLPDLARIQIELTHMAADITDARNIIFCPSYYSTDPILEKVFGKMPDRYWQDLGQKMDESIDIFWTGKKVCSESYSAEHLQSIEEIFERKVFLWDNYPVNDGAIKSQRLHLLPFHQSHAELKGLVSGHAANPMNQAHLSQIPLLSLACRYQHNQLATSKSLSSVEQLFIEIAGEQLGQELLKDADFFQTSGLKDMSNNQKDSYIKKYQTHLPSKLAEEVIEWLQGDYSFDPNCLTE